MQRINWNFITNPVTQKHEIINETDWYVSFPLNCNIEELKTWVKSVQHLSLGTKFTSGEYENALWWGTECHPVLKKRLRQICPLRVIDSSSNDKKWNTYIWEMPTGGKLNKHSDIQGNGTSFVIVLEGKFKMITYHSKFPDQQLDSYVINPGEIFVLKCGDKRFHSGECLTNYRLALGVYTHHPTDPFRDHSEHFVPWWGQTIKKIIH